MRYFVTGGAGFIGSNYVRGLLSGAWGTEVEAVTVFDAFTYAGNAANLAMHKTDVRLEIIKGDIRIPNQVESAIQGHDVVVHFAAESHVDRSIESSNVFVSTNVLGTQQVLESAMRSGVKRFVHISTDEVYGSIDNGSWTEDEPLLPNSPYAASKASSDLVARSYHRTFGFDVVITRCSNNFGPFQYPEKVIPLFVTNLIDGLKVPLYGDGLNIRDWLHVDDHCRGIQLVTENGQSGQIYNIGGGTELTNKELTALILDEFGLDATMIDHVPDRQGHDRRYSVDWTRINSELGYQPTQSLENSLGNLVDWYRNNEHWWRPLKKRA